MTWREGDCWALVLLGLAVYRVFKLIADDTILDRPRDALTNRLGNKAQLFILCPWCLGFWLSLGGWLAWEAWPHWTLIVAFPFALSAIVGLIASNLESD